MYINNLDMEIWTTKEIKIIDSLSIRYSSNYGINVMATVIADKIKIKKYTNKLTEIYITKNDKCIIYSEIKEPNYIYIQNEKIEMNNNIYEYTSITYNFLEFNEV